MSGLFEGDIFAGPRRGYGGLGVEETATPAYQSGDGLLPSDTVRDSTPPTWLPWALVGGGALVAVGIVWTAARKPVRANRRKRRRGRERR